MDIFENAQVGDKVFFSPSYGGLGHKVLTIKRVTKTQVLVELRPGEENSLARFRKKNGVRLGAGGETWRVSKVKPYNPEEDDKVLKWEDEKIRSNKARNYIREVNLRTVPVDVLEKIAGILKEEQERQKKILAE